MSLVCVLCVLCVCVCVCSYKYMNRGAGGAEYVVCLYCMFMLSNYVVNKYVCDDIYMYMYTHT